MRALDDLADALVARERFAPDPTEVRRALEPQPVDLDPDAVAAPAAGPPRRPQRHPQRRPPRRSWLRPALLAAACALVLAAAALMGTVYSQHNRPSAPSPSAPMGIHTSSVAHPTGTVRSAVTSTEPDAVPPVLRSGPFAMVPGQPGVNAGNQAEQTKSAAGGVAMLLVIDGCVRLWLPGADLPGTVVVFDSGSTRWDGTTLTYWGVPIPFGQPVLAGGGSSPIAETSNDPDAYLPTGCPRTGEAFYLNTLEPQSWSRWDVSLGTVVDGSAGTSQLSASAAALPADEHGPAIRAAWAAQEPTAQRPGSGARDLLVSVEAAPACGGRVATVLRTRADTLTLLTTTTVTVAPEECPAVGDPYVNRIAVPDGIVDNRPLTLVVDGRTLVLPPASG